MKLHVLRFNQDDPKKCTAAKMVKFKIANDVKTTKKNNLVLDPFSARTLLPKDKDLINSIIGNDCSWNLSNQKKKKKFTGIKRKLPPLLAGNPVNYSKLNKLTTAEAMAASLYIMGFKQDALKLLDKFKWGHTFYELNHNILEEYSKTESEDDVYAILQDYGLNH